MKNRGFTLVELLAVIVIISLLMVVAVPASLGISQKIKGNLFNNKLEISEKAAILWGQDNRNCFVSESGCSQLNYCTLSGDIKTCNITLNTLATEKYLSFDEGNRIIDPQESEKCLNNYLIMISYNTKNKTFSAETDREKSTSDCP